MMYAIDTREMDYEKAYLEEYENLEELTEIPAQEDPIYEYIMRGDDTGYFMAEMARIPLCTPEEEKEYMKRIKEGDENAKRNIRLILSVIKRSRNKRVEFLEHVQYGFLGLYKAIEKFDPALGYKFSTYATWWIRQAIGRYTSEISREVRVPVHVNEAINKMYREEIDFEKIHGRTPTESEMAELMGISVAKVAEIKKAAIESVSLYTLVGEDGETPLMEFIPSTDDVDIEVEKTFKREQVEKALELLTPRESKVLKMRFGIDNQIPMTLEQVGDIFGVTRERIRQIEAKALRRLRIIMKKYREEPQIVYKV